MNRRFSAWRALVAAGAAVGVFASAATLVGARGAFGTQADGTAQFRTRARNVIFFVGDGMGVSTVTAARVFSVGVAGQLVMDQFPYTALSRTYSSDSITADSAPTMSAMMTGVNTNQSVFGYGETTEANDFNRDGDGDQPWTLLELAKARGMKVGAVSTARLTHATPAATYAHVNHRDKEEDIAAQSLPTAATFNRRLGSGVDILMGGGRRFYVPSAVVDEEGGTGSRTDGRDLRALYSAAGYTYVWNTPGFNALAPASLPVLGLFERDHMEFEADRATDLGGEPSLTEMTVKSIQLLEHASRLGGQGYFLMVEGGRIDHAHHEGNAYRALIDTQEFDQAIGTAAQMVDLRETLIIVSADHSHVFNIAGYPLRPLNELPYRVRSHAAGFANTAEHGHGILDLAYDINQTTGHVSEIRDRTGSPYAVLGYLNGPGYRATASRTDPRMDPFPGRGGQLPTGPWDQTYLQEAAVPLASETHAGEDVAIYAVGPGSEMVRGTVKNTFIFTVMKEALGL